MFSDVDNSFAKKLGLVFQVDDELIDVYKTFAIKIDKAQGDIKKETSIPATYVIDESGSVLLAYVNFQVLHNYQRRLPFQWWSRP